MKKILLSLSVLFVVAACTKTQVDSGDDNDPLPPPSGCTTTPASFSTDVKPIIETRCATGSGCHGSGSFNGPGALTSFNEIKSAALSVKSAVVNKRMPLGSSLTAAQIQSISCWVDNGAMNN